MILKPIHEGNGERDPHLLLVVDVFAFPASFQHHMASNREWVLKECFEAFGGALFKGQPPF